MSNQTQPYFKVIRPTSSEGFTSGDTIHIEWYKYGVMQDKILIRLVELVSKGNKYYPHKVVKEIAKSLSNADHGIYNWEIPFNIPVYDKGQYKICIRTQNKEVEGYSDPFNINMISKPRIEVNSPDNHFSYEPGEVMAIRWEKYGKMQDKVVIRIVAVIPRGDKYYHKIVKEITSSTKNDGEYNWTVPNEPLKRPGGTDEFKVEVRTLDKKVMERSPIFLFTGFKKS